ncbi:hypothetical protein GCM10027598_67440 [Amycolatopsis oliviviridis]|uniref:Uncharacterized protein n=1 Tax=Amycolatopsis oliviviridis TaxID=1471590 RepID=A0ABQ3M2B9_9PSEU|nr:hypothetical protein [Amycolatopsis oliviviridis]GHH30087.1 hypothetical protein GCM10017790_63290 [Amycolatopsis oliviviridis]
MSEVWWGDFVRAVDLLAPGPADVTGIKELLGLPTAGPATDSRTRAREDTATAAATCPVPGVTPPVARDEGPEPTQVPARDANHAAVSPETATSQGYVARLRTTYRDLGDQPPPWHDAVWLQQPGYEPPPASLPHEPLFAHRTARDILQAALSRRERCGDIDLPALIDRICANRPVGELPRRPVPTTRFGVRLLLDRGEAMAPFQRDQADLIAGVRALTGRTTPVSWFFAESPDPALELRCPPGTRVLIVSAFDVLPHTFCDRRAWRRLVGRWRERDVAPVALLPFPASRVPGWLSGLMPTLSWDRTTTAAAVRGAVGSGAR